MQNVEFEEEKAFFKETSPYREIWAWQEARYPDCSPEKMINIALDIAEKYSLTRQYLTIEKYLDLLSGYLVLKELLHEE